MYLGYKNAAPTTGAVRHKKMSGAVLHLVLLLMLLSTLGGVAAAQRPKAVLESQVIRTMDQRIKAPTNKFPYTAVVKIKTIYKNGTVGWGTGAMIGSEEVLTASHVIYSEEDGGNPVKIEIYPGYNNGKTSCNPTEAKDWFSGWKQGCHDGASCDIAVIRTKDRVGCVAGWFGFRQYDPNNLTNLNIAGYPEDLNSGEEMYVVKTNAKSVEGNEHNIIGYRDWTYSGMSGGPIFTDDFYIVGIHNSGTDEENYGIGLCSQLYTQVKGWWSYDGSNYGATSPDSRGNR